MRLAIKCGRRHAKPMYGEMFKQALVLSFALMVTSCDYGVKWQDEPYEVHWIDLHGNRT